MISDNRFETTSTYDAAAGHYYERWLDRSAIQEHLDRFAAMLFAYDLEGQIILDVGCGPGFDAAILRRSGLQVIGVDLSSGMLAIGRKQYPGPYLQADMRHLPVAGSIGGLWVSASLLHLARAEAHSAIEQFATVLLPGGLLYISLKMGEGDDWDYRLIDKPRHFTYWKPEEFDTILQNTGLQIVDAWEGDGVIDRWLVRFARKPVQTGALPLTLSQRRNP